MYIQSLTHCDSQYQGDYLLATHVQDIEPVVRMANRMREGTNNGWTQAKCFQMIGEIPDVVFFNHPEFYNDDKALRRWLNSDEGQPFRVGRMKHRNETAGVIVK
jgi:hypothetical protein